MAFTIFMPVGTLHRMVYNSRLVDHKIPIQFEVGPGWMEVSAWDQHEYLVDYGEFVNSGDHNLDHSVSFTLLDHRGLEAALRDFPDDMPCSMELTSDGLFSVMGILFEVNQDPISDMSSLWDRNYLEPQIGSYAFLPKRMRKFPLIKPGHYPLDQELWYNKEVERNVLLWMCGPVRGAIIALDRTLLENDAEVKDYLFYS